MQDFDGYRRVQVNDPWNENAAGQNFYFVDQKLKDTAFADGETIVVPVDRMVCLSATHLAFLDALDAINRLVGVSSADYVVSDEFRHLVDSGQISEIGLGDHFKLETLMRLSPDVVMTSPRKGQEFELLRQAGITVLPNGDYLESHPLGRAEWIKFVGLLTGREVLAMHIFDSIKTSYDRLTQLTDSVKYRPTVLSGKQYGGFWDLPGGRSYVARLLKDAGADYLWAENPDAGSITLDFETVYNRGYNADFWRFLAYSEEPLSYDMLRAEDERYPDFKAFIGKKVLVCNTREKPYFQIGLLEPQVILADYIRIFHPELLRDYQPKYYHLLP